MRLPQTDPNNPAAVDVEQVKRIHFFRKQCALRLVKPERILRTFGEIVQMGFEAAILDSGNVVLPIMMNNQIMEYGGATELAIYGVIITTGSPCRFQK